ncbi:hypothetical protein RMCBS344292_09120 [Rhizopus microsporus]|nr:hypothetical protein RMCBS344292_09120 [Rhizopus microsporus]
MISSLILQCIEGQITSEQLEKELKDLIQTTLRDSSFRVQQGSKKEFWLSFCPAINTIENKQCIINLLKFARNIVAGELSNQRLAFENGALDSIQKRLLNETYDYQNDNTLILQVSTQAICNIITGNPSAIDFAWKEWMTDQSKGRIWCDILSKNNDDLLTSVFVLIINCISQSKQRCEWMMESEIGRKLLGQVLDDLERLHENQASKNFELGYAIFSELFTYGYFRQLYTLFRNNTEVISTRQTILLKLLDSKIHTYKDILPPFISSNDSKFLTKQFETVAKEIIQVIVSVKESQQQKSDLQVDQMSNLYTAIILLFQIINQLLLFEAKDLKSSMIEIDAMRLITDILGSLQTIKLPPAETDHPEQGFNFLKRECVRTIGTLCYEDKAMQDKAREIGTIPLILNQFKIDDSNPYLREYATLAIRNIMKDNIENQKMIEQLEPQQVEQTDELAQMGITPELLKDGKVRIKRTEL